MSPPISSKYASLKQSDLSKLDTAVFGLSFVWMIGFPFTLKYSITSPESKRLIIFKTLCSCSVLKPDDFTALNHPLISSCSKITHFSKLNSFVAKSQAML